MKKESISLIRYLKSQKMGELDSENKRFIITIVVVCMLAISIITVVLASSLDGNTKMEKNDIDKLT